MKRMKKYQLLSCCLASMLLLIGCTREGNEPGVDDSHANEELEVPTNRVAIPSAVRSNLGITFVTVERRRVEETLRVPGQFEYLPTARREYRTMLSGRIELLVDQFDEVGVGTPLFRVHSPEWRAMQESIADALAASERDEIAIEMLVPQQAAHDRHKQHLAKSLEIWAERVAHLESLDAAGGGRRSELLEAHSQLATTEAELASLEKVGVELLHTGERTRASLRASLRSLRFLLESAATLVGLSVDELTDVVPGDPSGRQRWATIPFIEVLAEAEGIVESIDVPSGSWVEAQSDVMDVVDPSRIRFRASGLQSDLGVLRNGLRARVVPPTPTLSGRAIPLTDTMGGVLSLGLHGDVADRTIDLYVVPEQLSDWALPGVTAQLEIVVGTSTSEELSIPMAAVQRDGLIPVLFRRAPDNPNEAIRLEGDLGRDDGRWIQVLSGLRDGDEVVLDGAFQLMLATSGSVQKGGHFHADGTFHAEDH